MDGPPGDDVGGKCWVSPYMVGCWASTASGLTSGNLPSGGAADENLVVSPPSGGILGPYPFWDWPRRATVEGGWWIPSHVLVFAWYKPGPGCLRRVTSSFPRLWVPRIGPPWSSHLSGSRPAGSLHWDRALVARGPGKHVQCSGPWRRHCPVTRRSSSACWHR